MSAIARNVAVISKATAERLWPRDSAIGKRFRLGTETRPPIEVIGTAGDVHGAGLDRNPEFTLYVPYWQGSFNPGGVSFIVRTDLEPTASSHDIRAALHDVDSELPLSAFRTMDDVLSESVAQRRFQMHLVRSFALAALVLASLRVYGVMSYSVVQRTGELWQCLPLIFPRDARALSIVSFFYVRTKCRGERIGVLC